MSPASGPVIPVRPYGRRLQNTLKGERYLFVFLPAFGEKSSPGRAHRAGLGRLDDTAARVYEQGRNCAGRCAQPWPARWGHMRGPDEDARLQAGGSPAAQKGIANTSRRTNVGSGRASPGLDRRRRTKPQTKPKQGVDREPSSHSWGANGDPGY